MKTVFFAPFSSSSVRASVVPVAAQDAYQPQNLVLKPLKVHDHDGFQLKESGGTVSDSAKAVDADASYRRARVVRHVHASAHPTVVSATASATASATVSKASKLLPDRRFYIKQLFRQYGSDNVMTFEGFEHLLANLGLNDYDFDHQLEDHRAEEAKFRSLHDEQHQHEKQPRLVLLLFEIPIASGNGHFLEN